MNIRLLLYPFSILFSGIARFRNFLFDTGIFKSKKFGVPVILVGNLSVGGTGKTPHIEYLISLLGKKYKLATLSRGYGRKTSGFVLAGKGSTAQQIGDEPMQYHSKFEDITVAVCEDRAYGIEKLIDLKKPDVILMDDGFQHRKVDAGFKILLTSYDRMFTDDFLLPAGDLREPGTGYKRADCIIVTGSKHDLSTSEKENTVSKIKPLDHQKLYFSSLEYADPKEMFGSGSLSNGELATKQVLLFTGIANPFRLEEYLRKHSNKTECIRFADHHPFTQKDMVGLREKFDKFAGASKIIVTTEKDFQRLRGTEIIRELNDLPGYFLPIKIKIDRQEEFNQIIQNYVETNSGIG